MDFPVYVGEEPKLNLAHLASCDLETGVSDECTCGMIRVKDFVDWCHRALDHAKMQIRRASRSVEDEVAQVQARVGMLTEARNKAQEAEDYWYREAQRLQRALIVLRQEREDEQKESKKKEKAQRA